MILNIPFLYKVPAPITYLVAPAAYFHIRFLVKKNNPFSAKDLLHLVPFGIFLISYVPFYFQSLEEKAAYVAIIVNDMSKTYLDNVGLIPEVFNSLGRVIIPVFYLILQWRIVLSKEGKLLNLQQKVLYFWSLRFVKLQTYYMASLYVATFSSEFFFPNITNEITANLSAILTVVFFFILSIILFWNQTVLRKLKTFNPTQIKSSKIHNEIEEIDKISKIVYEKKYFKNTKNNLQGISEFLEYEKTELSKIINLNYPSFNSWINHLKIRYCIELLKQEYLTNYSIEALANECGFNSRNTFYRAFKIETKMTPKKYILEHNIKGQLK
ncbi:MAG: AraC family transcriptional regulator [Polaribacter sp.]|nr:AraC family transcriptional regulator [Polaribacter sp.]